MQWIQKRDRGREPLGEGPTFCKQGGLWGDRSQREKEEDLAGGRWAGAEGVPRRCPPGLRFHSEERYPRRQPRRGQSRGTGAAEGGEAARASPACMAGLWARKGLRILFRATGGHRGFGAGERRDLLGTSETVSWGLTRELGPARAESVRPKEGGTSWRNDLEEGGCTVGA